MLYRTVIVRVSVVTLAGCTFLLAPSNVFVQNACGHVQVYNTIANPTITNAQPHFSYFPETVFQAEGDVDTDPNNGTPDHEDFANNVAGSAAVLLTTPDFGNEWSTSDPNDGGIGNPLDAFLELDFGQAFSFVGWSFWDRRSLNAGVMTEVSLTFSTDATFDHNTDTVLSFNPTPDLDPNASTQQFFDFLTTPQMVQYVRYDAVADGGSNFDFEGAREMRFYTGGLDQRDRVWQFDRSGDWNEVTNWNPAFSPPDTEQHAAVLGPAISAPRAVFTDIDVTVNEIRFESVNTYAVTGPGSVNLVAGTDSDGPVTPSISVTMGAHEFQARVDLIDDTTVDVANFATLEFVNRLSLGGNTLTKTGGGTLVISNTLNTGGGTVLVNGGVLEGGGTVGGDLDNNGGTISPGDNSGVLTVAGDVVPEPDALVLGLLAVASLFGYRSSRKKLQLKKD